MVLHRSMVNGQGVHLPRVYVHSSIGETYWMSWCCIEVWSIGRWVKHNGIMTQRFSVHSAICATDLVYGIPYIYGQFEGGTSTISICAFCYMLNIFSVVVFHGSMVSWRRGALVYVHSAICETSVV